MIDKRSARWMNLDDANEALQQGETREMYDVQTFNTQGENDSFVQNCKGMLALAVPPTVSGSDITIGAIPDKKKQRCFFFNYNTTGNHRILMLDIIANTITVIMQSTSLNFLPQNLIRGDYLNGNLEWCDGVSEVGGYESNQLRHLIVEDTSGNLITYGTVYAEDAVSLIKSGPKYPCTFSFSHDTSLGSINNISVFNGQFAARFIYVNGMVSRTNYISCLAAGSFLQFQSFTLSNGSTTNGSATITFDLNDVVRYGYPVSGAGIPAGSYFVSVNTPGAATSGVISSPATATASPVTFNVDSANTITVTAQLASNTSTHNYYKKFIKEIEFLARDSYKLEFKSIARITYPSNGSPSAISTVFTNQLQYAPVALDDTDFGYDFVPDIANDLIIGDSRTLLFNYTEGKNLIKPSLSGVSGTGTPTTNLDLNSKILKPSSRYKLCIHVYDSQMRRQLTYSDDSLFIQTDQQTTSVPTRYIQQLTLAIGSFVGTWAKYFSIGMTENFDSIAFQQVCIEHAYYVTGRDVNGTPRFTRQIGSTYNLTTTPSVDYLKTNENANSYQLSQLYLDQFNYIVNKNNSGDYAQATEIWIDLGNLLKYQNNVPYTFSAGDRVRLITLGGSTNVNANTDEFGNPFDYKIKEQKGRFIVIDGNNFSFNGIDSVDFGASNTRLTVAVNGNGEIYYSSPLSVGGYGIGFSLSTRIREVVFNKVAIQKINGDAYVVAVGNAGVIYINKYSTISISTAWKLVPPPDARDILNINFPNGDTSSNFFFCGSAGLFGRVDASTGIAVPYPTSDPLITQNGGAGTGLPIDIGSWEFRGLDVQTPGGGFASNYWVSLIAYTQSPGGQGGCAVAEINFSSYALSSIIACVPDSNAGNYNDCVSFNNLDSASYFNIVAVGISSVPPQGQISDYEYLRNSTISSRTLVYKGGANLSSSTFGELTAISKCFVSSLSLNQPNSLPSIVRDSFIYYACDINGGIVARGFWYGNYGSGPNQYYGITVQAGVGSTLTFPVTEQGLAVDKIYDSLNNTLIVASRPFSYVSIMQGQERLNDITISNQGSTVGNNVDGVIRVVGNLFGEGRVKNFGVGNTSTTPTIIDSFLSGTKLPVLNYGAEIEIYSPRKKSNISEFYESVLATQLTNQNTTTKYVDISQLATPYQFKIGEREDGDCFFIKKKYKGRLWQKNVNIVSMTPTANDITGTFFDTNQANTTPDTSVSLGWVKGNARPNVQDTLDPKVYAASGIKFSQQLISGTLVNGLNQFFPLNYKIYATEYGRGFKLQSSNDKETDTSLLLAVFEYAMDSIYLGKVQIQSADGQAVLSVADQVLGSDNSIRGDFGTLSPESIVSWNGTIWGCDFNKGIIWQYDANGASPISAKKMSKYFRNRISQDYAFRKDHTNYYPNLGFFDPYNNQYHVLFSNTNTASSELLGYDMTENRWKSFYRYTPQMVVTINKECISFSAGKPYQHTQTTQPNTYYGVYAGPSIIKSVFNKEAELMKVFQGHKSSGDLAVATVVQTNMIGLPQQECNLIAGDYVNVEGVWHADILKDKLNTFGYANAADAQINGDPISGTSVEITQQFGDSTAIKTVKSLSVLYEASYGMKP